MTATNYLGSSLTSESGNEAVIYTFPDDPTNLQLNDEITWGTIVGLSWDEGAQNGGTPILDYTVLYKDSVTDTWEERQVGVVGTSVTITDLVLGLTYSFKVKSRNVFDFSLGYSNDVSIYTATNPDKPDAPTTTIVGDNILIDWTAPNDNGLPITFYTVYIQKADPAFYSLDLVNCDGASSAVMQATQCSIPITDLMSTPFDLQWGDSVWAKVVATNDYGTSIESYAGNGALLLTKPDAPINLAEDASLRTADSITITWEEGVHNGGR